VILQVHGEVTDPDIDVFDREARFIDSVLAPVIDRYPELRVVFEHITTREAVEFVAVPAMAWPRPSPPAPVDEPQRAVTGGIRPTTTVCRCSRRSRIAAPSSMPLPSGDSRFFLGTDQRAACQAYKRAFCGCAGIFSAHAAIELYVEAFDAVGALGNSTASRLNTAPRLWLAIYEGTVTLTKESWDVPATYRFGSDELVPLRAGEKILWRVRAMREC